MHFIHKLCKINNRRFKVITLTAQDRRLWETLRKCTQNIVIWSLQRMPKVQTKMAELHSRSRNSSLFMHHFSVLLKDFLLRSNKSKLRKSILKTHEKRKLTQLTSDANLN